MTPSHADAPPPPERPAPGSGVRRGARAWRIATPAVVLLSGALFAVSAANSDGTDLRPGRYTDLATLVESEADDLQALQDQVASLNDDISRLTSQVADTEVRRRQRQADRLRDPAGLTPRSGEGVTVVLSDASADRIEAARADPELNLNRLVVHQQDIQAVVNALWRGGAVAVTIQGQRVVTTTGIKCTGSTVTLQGIPYPNPYTIQAVAGPGGVAAIEQALDSDPDVVAFRQDAATAEIGIGYSLEEEAEVQAPAYEGLLDISSARPQTRIPR